MMLHLSHELFLLDIGQDMSQNMPCKSASVWLFYVRRERLITGQDLVKVAWEKIRRLVKRDIVDAFFHASSAFGCF